MLTENLNLNSNLNSTMETEDQISTLVYNFFADEDNNDPELLIKSLNTYVYAVKNDISLQTKNLAIEKIRQYADEVSQDLAATGFGGALSIIIHNVANIIDARNGMVFGGPHGPHSE